MAQSARVTTGILYRVFMVESSFGRGSIFSIDVDGREYWITAKHILTGAHHPPYGTVLSNAATLKLLSALSPTEQWIPETFSVLDPGQNIDIVVLAAASPIVGKGNWIPPADSTGAPLGGDCEFLGFPFGGGWWAKFAQGQSAWLPYIKHCTISASIT